MKIEADYNPGITHSEPQDLKTYFILTVFLKYFGPESVVFLLVGSLV